METTIKGYQYKSNNHFSGIYEFPNNLNKEEIHLPPNTTLVAPPDNIPEGKEAMWYVDKWTLVDADESHITKENLFIPEVKEVLPENLIVDAYNIDLPKPIEPPL